MAGIIIISCLMCLWFLFNRNRWSSFLFLAAEDIVVIALWDSTSHKVILWLAWLVVLWWITSSTQPPRQLKKAAEGRTTITDPIRIKQGTMTGVRTEDGKVEVFAGIPYAKPPVGDLRWKEPQDPETFGLLKADHFGAEAMQKETGMFVSSLTEVLFYHNWYHVLHDRRRNVMSEDCLYLNIWKPAGKQEKLPVVFYIHGGSLTTGQSWWEDYNGESYARKGVVFITFSYRLNVFGFYGNEELKEESDHHTTGMYGFLDQVKALEWVRKNIAAFGGDPDNITIAGESAGSSCVNAMCTSPLAKGMFVRAIGESSSISAEFPAHSLMEEEKVLAQGEKLKEKMHVKSVTEMRKLPANEIMRQADDYMRLCALSVDGYALKEKPYDSYCKGVHNEQALLNGYNAHDGDFFALAAGKTTKENFRKKVTELYGNHTDEVLPEKKPQSNKECRKLYLHLASPVIFSYGHEKWSELSSKMEPVYEYRFDIENRSIGAQHTGELVYAYGNLKWNRRRYTEKDEKLSEMMQKYWLNFIRTGNPNGGNLPEWEKYQKGRIMNLSEHSGMIFTPEEKIHDVIDLTQKEKGIHESNEEPK